jgi:hypothetical protein
MNCKHEKAVKLLAELDTDKGVGLIERVRRGQGKPSIIYVRKFFDAPEVLTSENQKSGLPGLQKSRLPKNRSQEFRKPEANNINKNKTDRNETESSPSVRPARGPATGRQAEQTDSDEQLEEILARCELDIWEDERIALMFRTAIERLYYSESVKVGNAVLPRQKVRSYLWLLDSEVITGVYEVLRQNREGVRNVTGYIMSALINGACEKESCLLVNLPPEYLGNDDTENSAEPDARTAGAGSARKEESG